MKKMVPSWLLILWGVAFLFLGLVVGIVIGHGI